MPDLDFSALTAAPEGPRSVLRVLQVIDRLASCPEGQTLSQLSKSVRVPKTTIFTMLKVLASAGYVVSQDGTYRVGPNAIALGAAMVEGSQRRFPDCARGILQDLVQRTGETGFLAVLTADRQHCKYVATIEPENWLRYSVKVGSTKPAFATGTGRAMWAWLPAPERKRLVETAKMERMTSKTIGSRRALLAGLAEVRERGVSTVDSGTVEGVISIAAPIFGADSRVVAAVSVGGPFSRVTPHQRDVENATRVAAEEISRVLGYQGPWPAPG
jgi:DNA-binding IclR family transcriptional regulator